MNFLLADFFVADNSEWKSTETTRLSGARPSVDGTVLPTESSQRAQTTLEKFGLTDVFFLKID